MLIVRPLLWLDGGAVVVVADDEVDGDVVVVLPPVVVVDEELVVVDDELEVVGSVGIVTWARAGPPAARTASAPHTTARKEGRRTG